MRRSPRNLSIVLLALTGCGRIHFGSPGSDARPDADGDASDASTCTSFDVVIPQESSTGPAWPGIAWTGDRWYVIVPLAQGSSIVPFATDGAVGTPVDIIPPGEAIEPSVTALAWSGSRLVVLSSLIGDGNLRLRLFDPSTGDIVGPMIVNPSNAADVGRIVWTGDRFAVTWSKANTVYLRELDEQGSPLTAEMQLTSTGSSVFGMAVTPGRYVTVGSTGSTARTVVADRPAFAQPRTDPLDLGLTSTSPLIVAGPDGKFACVDGLSFTARLQMLGADGIPAGTGKDLLASSQYGLALQASATGYRLFVVPGGSTSHDVVRYELDTEGQIASGPVPFISFVSGTAWAAPSALAAPGRSLYVQPYDTQAGWVYRVVQSCP